MILRADIKFFLPIKTIKKALIFFNNIDTLKLQGAGSPQKVPSWQGTRARERSQGRRNAERWRFFCSWNEQKNTTLVPWRSDTEETAVWWAGRQGSCLPACL